MIGYFEVFFNNTKEASKISRKDDHELRVNSGIKSGIVGLLANLLLVIIKVFAGLRAGSVSILADAINSFGDSAGALLTIGGFYIANKPADEEHPYGHQRAEYISGLIISIIIIIVGIEFFISSIQKIMNPTSVESSKVVFYILLVSILSKVILAIYYHFLNKKIKTGSIVIEALVKDSLNDALMTSVIVISYLTEIQFDLYIDGYVGAAVALMIIIVGAQSILEASNDLLGVRPSKELVKEMQEVLDSYVSIVDYHDLLIHKYGPDNYFVTVHIEMDARWSLLEAHAVIDDIEREFKEKFNSATVCHLDPIVLNNDKYNKIYGLIKRTLKTADEKFHFHDFRVIEEPDKQEIHLDLVVPRHISYSDDEMYQLLKNELSKEYPEFDLILKFDRNYLLE